MGKNDCEGKGICEFKIPVNFKNGYIAEVELPLSDNPLVTITDIAKDNWQLPIGELNDQGVFEWSVKDVGNPKVKRMNREMFDRTFKVVGEKSIVGYPYNKKQ